MSTSTLAPSVSFRGLTKKYGSRTILDRLDLDVAGARITALLGPNGAGKTTLLKCLLGLVHPTSGEVLVGGAPIDAGGSYRRDIGFMPQLPSFPAHMTARALAAMLDDLRDFRERPDEELVDTFDLGHELDKPFRTLSGGTRQKVNAALAFRYGAPVMILDEPTAGLDPVSSMALKDKVRACREEGRTVVITSHNLGDLEALADDVVFLHEGRLRFAGPLGTLLEEAGEDRLEAAIARLMRPESTSAASVHGPGGHAGHAHLRVEVA